MTQEEEAYYLEQEHRRQEERIAELRAAYEAMKDEQRAEFEDYKRRCGGVPISNVKP